MATRWPTGDRSGRPRSSTCSRRNGQSKPVKRARNGPKVCSTIRTSGGRGRNARNCKSARRGHGPEGAWLSENPEPPNLDDVMRDLRDPVSRQTAVDRAWQHYKVAITYRD